MPNWIWVKICKQFLVLRSDIEVFQFMFCKAMIRRGKCKLRKENGISPVLSDSTQSYTKIPTNEDQVGQPTLMLMFTGVASVAGDESGM
jgi:hypothetical protein